jgi:hypothetical protein
VEYGAIGSRSSPVLQGSPALAYLGVVSILALSKTRKASQRGLSVTVRVSMSTDWTTVVLDCSAKITK